MIRQAATVMLLRPGGRPFEVFLVRRSARSTFAPGAYVFPGGALDERDSSPEVLALTAGLEPARLRTEFRGLLEPPLAAALSVTALRELFEEAGVLLAETNDGGPPRDGAALADARRRLCGGSATFAQILRDVDCRADATALTFFSRWITPPSEPRRYDAHFFLARAPDHQTPIADAAETHDGRWLTPQAALDAHARGELHAIYPTVKHLERLATFDDADAAIAFARGKPIVTVAPLSLPHDGFKIPSELENAW